MDAPSEKAVLSKLDLLQNKIKDGKIGVEELWASKRSLNEELSKVLGETRGAGNKSRARKLFGKISKDLNEELSLYGKKNPTFAKAFKEADQAYGALRQSERIERFIKKHGDKKTLSPALYGLASGIGAAATKGDLRSLTAPIVGAGVYKGAQIAERIARSPALRRHYAQVLSSAAKENAPAMNRALKKMDEELKREEKEKKPGRFKFVE